MFQDPVTENCNSDENGTPPPATNGTISHYSEGNFSFMEFALINFRESVTKWVSICIFWNINCKKKKKIQNKFPIVLDVILRENDYFVKTSFGISVFPNKLKKITEHYCCLQIWSTWPSQGQLYSWLNQNDWKYENKAQI